MAVWPRLLYHARPGTARRGAAAPLDGHPLTVALLVLFALAFVLRAEGSARAYGEEQVAHGKPAPSTLAFLGTAQVWLGSFQTWQSECSSVGVLVVLSIFLRRRGSPESKPVAAPHAETGGSRGRRRDVPALGPPSPCEGEGGGVG